MTGKSGAEPRIPAGRGRLIWLPIPLFVVTMAVLWVENSPAAYESQAVLALCNALFSTMAATLVAVLVARSFLARGAPELLLFGCGVLLWGAAGTLGSAFLAQGGNVSSSIHNILACLSAFCQLAGALLALKPRMFIRAGWLPLAAAYVGALGAVLAVTLLVLHGWAPIFFVQGQGGTPVRQVVLMAAILMFAGAAALLREYDRHAPTAFAKWYVPALLLIATGLFGFILQSVLGSALNWTARAAQMLGGAYMLVAAFEPLRDSRGQELSLAMDETARGSDFLATLRQQTPLGFVLRYTLPLVAIAASMGFRLVLEAWSGPGLPTYITFYPAVMAVALLAGFGPGLLAAVAAALAVQYWLLVPVGQFTAASTIDRLGVVIFLGMGLFMCLIAEIYRRNRDKVAAYAREAAVHESERLLHFHMDNSPMAVIEWDKDFIITRWTGRAEQIFGWSAAETIGKSLTELNMVFEEDYPIVSNTVAQLTSGKTGQVVATNRNYTKSGDIRYCTWYNSVLADAQGRIRSVLSRVIDITALKQAEQERQKYVSLADHSSEFIGMCDMNLTPFYVNNAALRLVGLDSPEAAFKVSVTDFFFPEDRRYIRDEFFPEVLKNGWGEIEIRFRHFKTGAPIWMIYSVFYIRDSEGQPVGLATVSRDITQRKLVEEALQKAHNELEQRVRERTEELAHALHTVQIETAERIEAVEALRKQEQMLIHQSRQAAMGEMIGNIAHQWRQPLNNLGLEIQQLLLCYDLNKFDREFLAKGVENSMELIQHMSRTIDDFRNYFKPDKEKAEFHVFETICNTMSLLEGCFNHPKIAVEIVAQEKPAIYGFQNEFAQVILNILVNARDALLERNVANPRVTITLGNENGRTVVTIADNAGGIPEGIIDKIFEPYFTTKGPQLGTGVGLFMSKTIIENNMGGRLTARNGAEGAEFRIEVDNGNRM